jgi:hypothetical protein
MSGNVSTYKDEVDALKVGSFLWRVDGDFADVTRAIIGKVDEVTQERTRDGGWRDTGVRFILPEAGTRISPSGKMVSASIMRDHLYRDGYAKIIGDHPLTCWFYVRESDAVAYLRKVQAMRERDGRLGRCQRRFEEFLKQHPDVTEQQVSVWLDQLAASLTKDLAVS